MQQLDQERKETKLKFYNAQVKYIDCSAEIKIKDIRIQKLKVYQMHCKLNAVKNQRLAEKYMVTLLQIENCKI